MIIRQHVGALLLCAPLLFCFDLTVSFRYGEDSELLTWHKHNCLKCSVSLSVFSVTLCVTDSTTRRKHREDTKNHRDDGRQPTSLSQNAIDRRRLRYVCLTVTKLSILIRKASVSFFKHFMPWGYYKIIDITQIRASNLRIIPYKCKGFDGFV